MRGDDFEASERSTSLHFLSLELTEKVSSRDFFRRGSYHFRSAKYEKQKETKNEKDNLIIDCKTLHIHIHRDAGHGTCRGSFAGVGMHGALQAEWCQAVFLRTGVLAAKKSRKMAGV